MNPYKVIIRSIDTEKTRYQASELNKYTFEVYSGANKIEIKKAIERIFGVYVKKVNVIVMPGKYGWRKARPPWKKAVVTLVKGQRLDLFEGAA